MNDIKEHLHGVPMDDIEWAMRNLSMNDIEWCLRDLCMNGIERHLMPSKQAQSLAISIRKEITTRSKFIVRSQEHQYFMINPTRIVARLCKKRLCAPHSESDMTLFAQASASHRLGISPRLSCTLAREMSSAITRRPSEEMPESK
jgi:hypothetical protein